MIKNYNPFSWFSEAALKHLKIEDKAIYGGLINCCKVVSVNGAETFFYDSCANCEGMFAYKAGMEACPYCLTYELF